MEKTLIRHENGKLYTEDELYDLYVEKMCEVLDDLDTDDLLAVCNAYREKEGGNTLYENNESELNDQLEHLNPYELLELGYEDWSPSDDFFAYTRRDGFTTTNDIYEDIDQEDLARELLDECLETPYSIYEIRTLIEEYTDAKDALEKYNPYREKAEEVIRKFTNCEADVTDLLQVLDKLVRTDEAWKEGE